MPEPWLRETELPCHAAVAAVIFALDQAEEDLARIAPPPSADFHLRHIAGSLDRLTTYLENCQLSEAQLAVLHTEEKGSGESREQLLAACRQAFEHTRKVLLKVPAGQFEESRFIGRQRIRTTAIGLMIHIAEHTQRHIGQIIAYSRAASVA